MLAAVVFVACAVAVVTLVQGCAIIPSSRLNDDFSFGLVWGPDRSYYVDSYGKPIVLLYNKNARDPSYTELVAFLNADKTDLFPYDESGTVTASPFSFGDPRRLVDRGFWLRVAEEQTSQPTPRICSDFAEMLHNDAEIHGIRAGYVTITLASSSSGHAIDVFNTTDRGLVFIDDTGGDPHTQTASAGPMTPGDTGSWDKVAYLEAGKPYGVISLSVADQYGLDYSGYDKWLSTKQEFDSIGAQYDSLRAGRSVVPRTDYDRLQTMAAQMSALAEQLGDIWKSLGTVTDFNITWE
jgi:hypothetical protein